MIPGILFIALSMIFFVIAYLLYYKEAYWLISGINLGPRQTVHERYNLSGLTKHMGRMCALIGLVMLASGVGAVAGLEMMVLIPVSFIFVIVPVFLFGSERYLYVGRKRQRILNIVITGFVIAVAVFTVPMLVNGAKAPEIRITENSIVIESVYGTEIPLDSIEKISMVDLSGKEFHKLNGFNMGDTLKGSFRVENLENVTVYLQENSCPSILLETADRTYLINLGSETENNKLKKSIIEAKKTNDM